MIHTAHDAALAFVAAINDHDVPRILSLAGPRHRFIDSLGNVVSEREALEAAWRQYFTMVPDYHVAVLEILADRDTVVLLGTASGTYSADGRLERRNQWQTPVALRARAAAGHVIEWQVYADNEPLRARMRTPSC
jgi:ketosteroid isomerase-like protein